MAKRYADTPEGIAARTSVLEKQIKVSRGKIPRNCVSHNFSDMYCPPINEEIRLAMMRRHVRVAGYDQINGHMLHGQMPTPLTVAYAAMGKPGRATIGMEVQYQEAQLLQTCQRERDANKLIS